MLTLRALEDTDIPLVEVWLNQEHVRRWFEIPRLGVTVNDWMCEIKERNGAFQWLTYLIAQWQDHPIGLCLYYQCADSGGEDFGSLPLAGSYGIDYLIGEKSYLGKGLGKCIIAQLVETVFSFPDAQCVTADTDKDNKPSGQALRSSGFALLHPDGSRYVIHRGTG